MKWIMLSEAADFLKETHQVGFLKIVGRRSGLEMSFIAGKNWWANVLNDIEMAPGCYIFNLNTNKWRVEAFQAEQMVEQINTNIKGIYDKGYYKADFERRGSDIVMFRGTEAYWSFDNSGPFYKLVLGGKTEPVDAKTFDFLYTNLSPYDYVFLMNLSENKPIVFIENPFGTDAFRPRALIFPISANKKSFVFFLDRMSFESRAKVRV